MTYRPTMIMLLCLLAGTGAFLGTVLARQDAPPAAALAEQAPLLDWLGVSTNQRAELAALDPDFTREAETLRQELLRQRQALADLLEDPAATEPAVLGQLQQVNDAEQALQRRIVRYVMTVREDLTVQQQMRLMGLASQGLCGGGGRQQHRHGQQGRQGAEPPGPNGRGNGGGQGGGGGRGWQPGRGQGSGAGQPASTHDTIASLLDHHQKIQRLVEDLPDGVVATTTSDDPTVAALIRHHVSQMKQRLESGHPMRRFDPLFEALFDHSDQIDMRVEEVPGGVRVTETSANPQVVLLIRQHARAAVSQFVEQGPARVHQPTPLPEGYRP